MLQPLRLRGVSVLASLKSSRVALLVGLDEALSDCGITHSFVLSDRVGDSPPGQLELGFLVRMLARRVKRSDEPQLSISLQ